MSDAARHTAEERREAVLDAAVAVFAVGGLHGAATDDIATAAGISQPYLFRLFGTKKKLFVATIERCMEDTLQVFRAASDGLHGEVALQAMGEAYVTMVRSDPNKLLCQMQAYVACEDPDVRETMRAGYRHLFEFVEARSGASQEVVSHWFAQGMLLNVVACMDLWSSPEPWAQRLIQGCVGAENALEGTESVSMR